MRAVHMFAKMYGWSKKDVMELTLAEANYLSALISDEKTWQEQLARQRR
jgi:hypothetical protein